MTELLNNPNYLENNNYAYAGGSTSIGTGTAYTGTTSLTGVTPPPPVLPHSGGILPLSSSITAFHDNPTLIGSAHVLNGAPVIHPPINPAHGITGGFHIPPGGGFHGVVTSLAGPGVGGGTYIPPAPPTPAPPTPYYGGGGGYSPGNGDLNNIVPVVTDVNAKTIQKQKNNKLLIFLGISAGVLAIGFMAFKKDNK